MSSWIKSHWRKVAGIACGAATVVLLPINPMASAALGVACGAAFGSDVQIGKTVANAVRAIFVPSAKKKN